MAAAELENCINFWEGEFFYHRYLMEPSTLVFVESTIQHLKELRSYKAQLPQASKDVENVG